MCKTAAHVCLSTASQKFMIITGLFFLFFCWLVVPTVASRLDAADIALLNIKKTSGSFGWRQNNDGHEAKEKLFFICKMSLLFIEING